jgi:hypothetical protein
MKVNELIEKLQAMPPDSDVLFDTEAAQFHMHMVSVDSAFHEEEPRPHCGLHTSDPREYTGARDRKLAALITAAGPIRDYFAKLAAWSGGCALPSDPTEGQKLDFVNAVDAVWRG